MDQLWREHKTPEGRPYYYNTQTRATQWTKPDALLKPSERALANQPWKEYTAEGGRKYWYNTETKQSSWEIPEVYKNALAQSAPFSPQAPVPSNSFVAGGGLAFQPPPFQRDRERDDHIHPDRAGIDRTGHFNNQTDGLRNNFLSAGTNNNEPEFANAEEAESVFMKLLKRSNVQTDWTWEETMKAVVKDPHYRAIKDPKDRKAAFEKFQIEARQQDKEREKERLAKLRQDFGSMLKSHPDIKHYTRWKTARPVIEGEMIYKSAENDTERRQLFEEYVQDLKKAHTEAEAVKRKSALEELTTLLKGLNLEPYTRWSDAKSLIDSNGTFQKDAKFRTLTKSDVLNVFVDHIKGLERSFNDARQQERAKKSRRERKNREAYTDLLRDLRSTGKIRAGTKWTDIHGLVEDDPRYRAMLGQSGSTPLDLFWDTVEDEERNLRGKRNEVLDVLDDKRFEITSSTTLEEFLQVIQADRRTNNMNSEDAQLIFQRLYDKVLKRNSDDKHHAERASRRAMDALRSRIKRLDPPVRITDSWEHDVRPRLEKYEEYKAFNNDEIPQAAFEKVIRRMKDREFDAEQADRWIRGGNDREIRTNGHRRTRGNASSRTPEPDAYEADRRKAIADRERQYRKSSASGLSPPSRESPGPPSRRRDRYDDQRERERDRDRYDGRRGSGPDRGRDRERDREHDRRDREYDRETRERERDRASSLHLSRADPRDHTAKELDYGDSGADGATGPGSVSGSSRRRRDDSDEDDGVVGRRDSKRARRDRSSRTPVPSSARSGGGESSHPAATTVKDSKDEDTGFKSGSEEGEIEEE